jgi:rhamnogalacturonyl hydrolase YesR
MTMPLKVLKRSAKTWLEWVQLPPAARAAVRSDSTGLAAVDPGPKRVVEEGIAWLGRAQDNSATKDEGVARHYSVIDGWAPSYPETTGYIVDTLLTYGRETGHGESLRRARRMLDWFVAIQFAEGGFQGGMVNQTPRVPVTFNTGQILIGLASGAGLDERYRQSMQKAADWLVATLDPDGCWRKHGTPFAAPGEKTYETHVSLGLFRAHGVDSSRGYLDAGLKQVDWALTNQAANGWLAKCCLSDPVHPLTHTLGYALRGVVEAYLASKDDRYLNAACLTADGLLGAMRKDGMLPGRLDANWQPAADWVCLTGLSQIAESWLLLHRATGRDDYKRAGLLGNSFVRRTISLDGPPEIRGAVKGSFPIDGHYGRWQYLNWACKFTVDANRAELALG